MPTIEQLITLIENKGVGFALILGVGYLLYLLVKGVRKAVADFYDLAYKLVHNHAAHLQASMETLVTNSNEANKKLDAQTQMLGIVIENTRPKKPDV